MSYLRSVHLHKDKSVFKLDELPLERFAESLGLPGAPKVKFLKKQSAHATQKLGLQEKGARKTEEAEAGSTGEESDEEEDGDDSESSESGDEKEDRIGASIKVIA